MTNNAAECRFGGGSSVAPAAAEQRTATRRKQRYCCCCRKKGGARGGFFQSSSVRLGHHHQRSHQIGGSFPSPLLYGPSTLWYTNKVRGKQVGSFFKSRFGTSVARLATGARCQELVLCYLHMSLKNTSWWFLVLIFPQADI